MLIFQKELLNLKNVVPIFINSSHVVSNRNSLPLVLEEVDSPEIEGLEDFDNFGDIS